VRATELFVTPAVTDVEHRRSAADQRATAKCLHRVTLDLNGHTLRGDPAARAAAQRPTDPDQSKDRAGIVLRRVSGSTVRDGTVEQFDAGIAIRGGSGNVVDNVTVQDNINYRVVTGVDADPGPTTPSCDYGDGIAVFNSEANVVEDSRIVNNGPLSGVSLVEDSDGNKVSRNVIADNDVVNRTPLGLNTVCGTGPDQGPMSRGRTMQDSGVRIEGPGADDNRVQRNEVTANGLTGIAIHGYVCRPPATSPFPPAPNNGGNLVFKNTVSNTGSDGLDPIADGIATLQQGPPSVVCVASGNTIKNNVSTDNDRHGIFMGGRGSSDNRVINNRTDDNAGDGLHLEGPQGGKPGAIDNKLLANKGSGNAGFDGFDGNEDCDNNLWRGSKFGSVNQPCVLGPGGGQGTSLTPHFATAAAGRGARGGGGGRISWPDDQDRSRPPSRRAASRGGAVARGSAGPLVIAPRRPGARAPPTPAAPGPGSPPPAAPPGRRPAAGSSARRRSRSCR
jgi:parallel beta-helix repeat protein